MTTGDGPGFDYGSVAADGAVPLTVDDEDVAIVPADPEPVGAGSARASLVGAASVGIGAVRFAPIQRLVERVPAASRWHFQTTDSLGGSTDALDVIENPLARGSYLGVYHIDVGGGRMALRLAASPDLVTWRKIADLDAAGAAMGTLHALPDGGFLLACEVQGPTQSPGLMATNVELRHYADGRALLSGVPTERRALARRISPTNEGTPNFRAVSWGGSLATSHITLGLHYLDWGTERHHRPFAVDRQGSGTLDEGRWSVVREAGVDRALSGMNFHGNHGGRRDFRFPVDGHRWRIYEAQRVVNRPETWRLVLYDVGQRRTKLLRVKTPRGSTSFANPTVRVLPSPGRPGAPAVVITIFIFGEGAGAGEAGELVYYHDL